MTLKHDAFAALGEFVLSTSGTTLFLFLALGGAKTSQVSRTASQLETETTLGNQTIMFISVSFGLSLLVTAWCFYRITGGLFNPAITLALYLVGAVPVIRACMLTVAQLLGGIAGAGLVAVLTPYGGAASVETKLQPGINKGQGLMIEALLTAILVFSVLMLAAEKHKSTYLAPIGIGLTIFACHLVGTLWTGCGINPARSLGPSVIAASFPGYFWIYVLGPIIGSFMAVAFYALLKAMDYTQIVFGQDSDHELPPPGGRPTVKPIGAKVFSKGRKFLVLRRDKSKVSGTTSGSTLTGHDLLSTVVAQELVPGDAEQRAALRSGEAVVVEMDSIEQLIDPATMGFPSMRAEAQDAGGIQAPGTVETGIAAIDKAREALTQ